MVIQRSRWRIWMFLTFCVSFATSITVTPSSISLVPTRTPSTIAPSTITPSTRTLAPTSVTIAPSTVVPVTGVPTMAPSPPTVAPSTAQEPTFFISFHGGDGKKDVNDVYRYSLSGALLQKHIFSDGEAKNLHGLRGLLYVESQNMLLVTNAFNQDSRIIKLDVGPSSSFACTGLGLAENFVADGSVLHPYGIQLNPVNQTIMVSNQGDVANPPQNITQYDLAGRGLANPVFATVGEPRDLYWAAFGNTAFLFVCDKATDRVLKFDVSGTKLSFTAKVRNPIALHTVTPPPGEGVVPWLLVSSNDASEPGVFALDFLTGGDTTGSKTSYKRKFADPELIHPCGLASLGTVLYVLSQDTYSLLSFDLVTGARIAVVISALPDIPEDLMLVSLPACSVSPTRPTPAPPEPSDGAVAKIPPVFFIASGTTLGVALTVGAIIYWCKRRRDHRRSHSIATPLTTERSYEPPLVRGSLQNGEV